jgi:prolipoprotein diacylglyceryltransferase
MYPVLFRIGDFEVTSFGVLVAIGALVGLWMFRRELRLSGLPDEGVDAAVAGMIGGLAGAKLLWVLEHLREESVGDLLLSRGGMSWFGGFAGGVLAGLMVMHRNVSPKCKSWRWRHRRSLSGTRSDESVAFWSAMTTEGRPIFLGELLFPRGCLQP